MRTILKFFTEQSDQFLLMLGIALVAMVVTYLIYWITGKNSFLKYLLGLILIFAGSYNLYQGLINITRQGGLDTLSKGINLGLAGLVSIFFALLLGGRKKKRSRARRGGRK